MKRDIQPGKILLLGSGETTQAGGQAFEALVKLRKPPVKIRLLETPAGFELNSPQVVGRVGDYMKTRLQNHKPEVNLVAARVRSGEFGTESSDLAGQLADTDLIFMGPGSPSYAVRQLAGSIVWKSLIAAFLQGADLAFASAAAVAVGKFALPVYEIYKVGEDPIWKTGLDLFSLFGLDISILPHWNNNEGGKDLDTSRCFIGRQRFEYLAAQLPGDHTIIGLDEKTGLIIDPLEDCCGKVIGKGQVHLMRNGAVQDFSHGEEFPHDLIGKFRMPELASFDPQVWEAVLKIRTDRENPPAPAVVPEDIELLLAQRKAARAGSDWSTSDKIRQQLALQGWQVIDTPEGQKIERID